MKEARRAVTPPSAPRASETRKSIAQGTLVSICLNVFQIEGLCPFPLNRSWNHNQI